MPHSLRTTALKKIDGNAPFAVCCWQTLIIHCGIHLHHPFHDKNVFRNDAQPSLQLVMMGEQLHTSHVFMTADWRREMKSRLQSCTKKVEADADLPQQTALNTTAVPHKSLVLLFFSWKIVY